MPEHPLKKPIESLLESPPDSLHSSILYSLVLAYMKESAKAVPWTARDLQDLLNLTEQLAAEIRRLQGQ